MAIKDKQRVSENKLGNVISNDYRWTNIVLTVIATISAAFSVLIIVGALTINDTVPVIGQFPVAFGWVLFAIAIFGLGLVVWPFVRSAFPEFTRITWAGKKEYGLNLVRVFFFMILMALVLLFFEYVIIKIQQGLM